MFERLPRFFAVTWLIALGSASTIPVQNASADKRGPTSTLKNPGFENGQPGEHVTDWFASWQSGSEGAISDQNPKEGKQCASLRVSKQAENKRFAVLSQPITADSYQGKRVRFRAAVRLKATDESSRAQLWFRVDRNEHVTGAFDNMADRPIQSDTWEYYDIVGDVAPDAKHIIVGMMVFGDGQAFIDDASFEIVDQDVAATAKVLNLRPMIAKRNAAKRPPPKRIPLSSIGPGLFEIRGANEVRMNTRMKTSQPQAENATFLFPLPLSYRDQVPLSWELTTVPAGAMKSVEVYQGQDQNYVAKVVLNKLSATSKVDINFRSTVLVRPSLFDDVPEAKTIPAEWAEEARAWLQPTWCADSENERIAAIGKEIRTAAKDDVLQIIREVEVRAKDMFRSAEGRVTKLTAVQALDARGSCTSCANLVAAMLRASNVPARVLAGYPSWSGPLQTHYLVEAYVPDYGWYPIESTMCRSPWANMYQVNVAVIPTDYESQKLADRRYNAAGGVPYLSLTESPGNQGQFLRRGTLVPNSSCDHECQQIRKFSAQPDQWDEAFQKAGERWKQWVNSKPNADNGVLSFGVPADRLTANSLTELNKALSE